MVKNIDDFLCEAQCEELYDEQVIQEMNEFYAALDKQEHEQEPNQNWRKGLCKIFGLW